MSYAVPAPRAAAPPSKGLRLRARLRRSLVLDFAGLDRIDLGDRATLNAETAELFSRGGHRPARA